MKMSLEALDSAMTAPPVLGLPDFNKKFLVETTVSTTAFGAFLAQEQEDRKINAIKYASLTMTLAEQNYFTWEREALEVVFAMKKYRMYFLYTEPFNIPTDNQVLRKAVSKKDEDGHLAW